MRHYKYYFIPHPVQLFCKHILVNKLFLSSIAINTLTLIDLIIDIIYPLSADGLLVQYCVYL